MLQLSQLCTEYNQTSQGILNPIRLTSLCHSIDLQTQMLRQSNTCSSNSTSNCCKWSLFMAECVVSYTAHSSKWIQIQIRRYADTAKATATATDKYSYQLWRVKWLFCLVIFVFEYVVSFCFLSAGVFVLAPPCTMTRAETCFPLLPQH